MFKRGIVKRNKTLFDIALIIVDLTVLLASALIAYYIKYRTFNVSFPNIELLALAVVALYITFMHADVYQSYRGTSLTDECIKVLYAVFVSFLMLFAVFFIFKIGSDYSRIWILFCFINFSILTCCTRIILRKMLSVLRLKGWNNKEICLITYGNGGGRICSHIKNNPHTGYIIKTIFSNEKEITGIDSDLIKGNLETFQNWIKSNTPDQIWIDIPVYKTSLIEKIIDCCKFSTSDIVYIPDINSNRLINSSLGEIVNMPVINLSLSPMSNSVNIFVKRLEDIILSIVILLLVSPIMLLLAIIIKLTSEGPVIFKQQRHGYNKRTFFVYKFRSMMVHQEQKGVVTQAKQNDPRVTAVGRFIRKTSLDELPQIFNVLKGDMSIVGPRPHAIEHNEFYKSRIELYMKRHIIKPGITGWAQINGFRGETLTIEQMESRIKYDLYYIERWSLLFDIKIIILTIFKVFLNKNAY